MQIKQMQEGGVHVFSLSGRFDAHSAGDVEEELGLAVSGGARKVLINLDGTEYISSAGLRVLLGVAKKLKKEAGEVRLCCLKSYVKEVFDIAGFTQIFKIYNTAEEALQTF